MALPTRGLPDWDDELNNHINALDADVQSAAARSVVAASDAAYARNRADEVHTAVVQPIDDTVAGWVPDSGSATGAALAASFAPAVVLTGAGIDPTGATDSTAALQALYASGIAAGARKFVGVPGATYKVAIASGSALFSVTTDGITFDMAESTLDNSATSYTADELTPMWLIDAAKDTTIRLGEYVGFTLPAPASYLGTRGATLVRAINAAQGVTVDARATNLRYGVQTGDYATATTGQCENFDIKLRGSMIGYPLAAYYADHIRHDIDVDGVHRGVYIAGCDDVRGTLRWRDQYIADTAYLITDCLTSGTDAAAQVAPPANPTTSRGCSNVDVVSIDKGSTVFAASSRCAGLGLSRVDPVTFRNIRVGVFAVGTDTVSTKVGGWMVASAAKSIHSRYAFNWEPTVVLDSIEVYGTVDHSGATLEGNSGSEFYMVTYDTTTAQAATVRGFRVNGFTFRPSAGNLRRSFFHVPGLATPATFTDFNTPAVGLDLFTSTTVATVFERATLDEIVDAVGGGAVLVLGDGTVVTKKTTTSSSRKVSRGGSEGGGGAVLRQRETTLTLTGATVTWSSPIPAGALILGVQGRVGTAITGATGYQVGISTDLTKYVNTNTVTAGSTFGPQNASAAGAAPHSSGAGSTSLVVTAKVSNFTAGTLRLLVTYMEFPALTVT